MPSLLQFLGVLILLLFPEPSPAEDSSPDYISDAKISSRILSEMTKIHETGKFTPLQQLRTSIPDRNPLSCNPIPESTLTLAPDALYRRCITSIGIISQLYKCSDCPKWHSSHASGFFLSTDGIFITNHHVLFSNRLGALYTVMTQDFKIHLVDSILACNPSNDLALCKVQGTGFQPLPLRLNAPVGTPVAVIGHDANCFYMMTSGIISRYFLLNPTAGDEKIRSAPRMSITADFARGSSGAPILDMCGNVVGIASSTRSIYYDQQKDGAQNNLQMVIKQGIPAEFILKILAKKLETGSSSETPR